MNVTEKEELIDELQAHYQQVLEVMEHMSPFTELTTEHLRMAGMRTVWTDFVYDPIKREINGVGRNRREFLPIVERMIKHPEENMIQ